MGPKKDLSFWCCPATASDLHLKEWSDCTAHLHEWTITTVMWRWAGRGMAFYHYKYKNAWRWSGKQLPQISLLESQCVRLKGQWSTTSLQSRAAGFDQAGKGEAGRGQGERSFVMVFWRTGARPALWRGSQLCFPLWENMVWEHGNGRGRGRQRGWWDFFRDPGKSMSIDFWCCK